jgi:hypothetical protein
MRKTVQPPEQERRRFAFAHAGELWMSDVMLLAAVEIRKNLAGDSGGTGMLKS